ncbi:hypothetical protein EPUS_07270 [Endocarpon pusillum Z07020]|uniref:Uncharacterized protein n=1 Tax=Endocarpon pusillum (strain Z07020 / HMAS-L-300199) TaxID=1263415 RepID=U1G9V1_ENDPU|nr:uncharacterized protein EPUS_07270 [Endocarpon pusillum Z07020]ERF68783.1 hypothetical protein EPUS_07270 [Endocarpon pusillum Z07020]
MRQDTSVPMASVAVVAPFDTIIEAGVDAVVSGQRQRLEDWVAKKAEPSITRPENATHQDTLVPIVSVAVVAPFDTIIEAGVDAVVSGQRQRLEDWVKVAVGRDRPYYQ